MFSVGLTHHPLMSEGIKNRHFSYLSRYTIAMGRSRKSPYQWDSKKKCVSPVLIPIIRFSLQNFF